eukprot:4945881-Pleurochrysis_carterae.AAC.2
MEKHTYRSDSVEIGQIEGSHHLSLDAHALELVRLAVAAALLHLVVLVALEGGSCCSGSVGWVADECELLGGLTQGQFASGNDFYVALAAMRHVALVAGLGVGGGAHGRL